MIPGINVLNEIWNLEWINFFATTTVNKMLFETAMIYATNKNSMGKRSMTTTTITITIASNYVIHSVSYLSLIHI